MTHLEVLGIIQDSRNNHPVVILRNEDRFLPIVVGKAEAEAIQAALVSLDLGRPMTHDLICNLLAGLRGELKSIVIYKLERETFYAHLNIEQKGITGETEQVLRVDTRPSDGIAIACRLNTPIYVAEEVMEQASQDMAILNMGDEPDDDSDEEDDEFDA